MEQWRPISGEPAYEVSDHGSVRSLEQWRGDHFATRPVPRLLSLHKFAAGYPKVALRGGRQQFVHRLVATAFLPMPANAARAVVNHLNGVKADNHVSNLEWTTDSGNMQHAYDNGLRGRSALTKLTETDVVRIRSLYPGLSQQAIAKSFGVSQMLISGIVRNIRWTHVNSNDPSNPQ